MSLTSYGSLPSGVFFRSKKLEAGTRHLLCLKARLKLGLWVLSRLER